MLDLTRPFALTCAWLLSAAVLLAPSPGSGAEPAKAAIAAEHPRAAEIGVSILAAGGSVVDAAIASAFAVCVLNLSSCGPGGGGFMLGYEVASHEAYALDFREVAPAAVRTDLLFDQGELQPPRLRRGGLAVAVPGFVAGLVAAQARFGRLALPQVIAPAIELARGGFPIGEHLAEEIRAQAQSLREAGELGELLFDQGGKPKKAGANLAWPALASTLEAVASRGAAAFYRGDIARAMAATVQTAGGVMTERDLASYQPLWRKPLAGAYREVALFTMPPPGSGGILLEILNVLQGYDLAALGNGSPTYLHLVAEVMKAGFADRALWYGDPDYAEIPLSRLLSREHAQRIRAAISPLRASTQGEFGGGRERGTSHLSVIDQWGNAAAVTVTINTPFGAQLTVPGTGIVLNDEMDDFSLPGGAPNAYGLVGSQPNQLQPGKRPLSSMSPTVLVSDGRATLALGASGGPKIISATLQVLLGIVDFGHDGPAAVAQPRIHHQGTPPLLFFEGGIPPLARLALARLGHGLMLQRDAGAVQVVARSALGLDAAADPRKHGGVAYWRQAASSGAE